MGKAISLNRRCFLGSGTLAVLTVATGGILGSGCHSTRTRARSERKVFVGGHPWVYAATQPNYDIETFGDRIVFLHIRDQNADGTWSEAVGEGDMDHVAIDRALRATGFSGDAVIELAHERNFKPTRPLRDSLRMSRVYVRETLGF